MKIHCLYRDFFLFLKALEIEENRWHCFNEYYFSKYRDFLSAVWYKLQGYTKKNIKERVFAIKRSDYSDLEAELKLYDIEDNSRRIINKCREFLYYPEICNIYLFIGFFSPDAFVFRFKDNFVIAVGLERFHNFKNYPILLAHEYCHYIQNMINEDTSGKVKDRIIREGISVCFSEAVYSGKEPWEYLFIKRENYYQLEEKYQYYLELLEKGDFEDTDIFHGFIDNQDNSVYPRAGYFIGYKIVKNYIERDSGKNLSKKIDFMKLIREKNLLFKTY